MLNISSKEFIILHSGVTFMNNTFLSKHKKHVLNINCVKKKTCTWYVIVECLLLIICTIYIYCRKIYNLFVWTLEIGRKVSIWQAFLACFVASAN